MSVFLASAFVIGFAVLLARFRLEEQGRHATATARASLATIRSPDLSDADKERELRKATLELLRLFAGILGRCALALFIPLAAVWLLDIANLASLEETVRVLGRPWFLLMATAVGGLAYALSRRTSDA